MAAKDLNDSDTTPLEVMTTCCICNEVYTDLIALPCVHTFCMKCLQNTALKSNKDPGDEILCPICRRMFKIPPEGYHGFPKNVLIEWLVQVANHSDQSASSMPTCDGCVEESEEAGKEVPAADTYCVDCNQKFCQECCRHHRKFKQTKNHDMVPINEHESDQNVMNNQAPSVCKLHDYYILNIYCSDCKTVVCAMCFIDDHSNHKGAHVNKFMDGFRKQIESNVEAINECRCKAEMKKAELLKVKEGMQERLENLERQVEARKAELKLFTDKQMASLVQSLYSMRQKKLKEIQMTTDDIDAYLSSLETYNSYSQNIIAMGSACGICRVFPDLSDRAVDLQQQCHLMVEREIENFNIRFHKSELEVFLQENCNNLIGEIEADSESKAKEGIKPSVLSQQSKENERLRKEIKSEITYRESLRLTIAQLRINMNKEHRANKVFIEELTKKLDATIVTNKSLQDQIDKLKQELDKEKMTNSVVQVSNNQFLQEMNAAYKVSIRTLEDDAKKPMQELDTTETVDFSCKSDPVLIQTIKTKAAEEKRKSINGLTILDKELFVVSKNVSEVEVYDLMGLTFSRRLHLKELVDPIDIGSCNKNKCLYIFDVKNPRKPKQILRVDANGNLIKNWSVGNDFGWSLSVTYESNIILTLFNKGSFKEYSPDGQLIREIKLYLSAKSGLCMPWHAIKLTNGHLMVSLGMSNVCMVDGDGKLLKSIGSEHGMKRPVNLSVDGNGFFMVADQLRDRVLLFDSDFQFKREILSKATHGLQHPWRILMDESSGRLFVADINSNSGGRILIFDLK